MSADATLDRWGEIASIAADHARRAITSGTHSREVAVWKTSPSDFATETDHAVERETRDLLERLSPDIPVLGEEFGGTAEHDLFWVVDPIDGTLNFARNLPLFGFQIALVHNGRPVVGVVDLPFLDKRYYARSGAGAYLNDARLTAAADCPLDAAVVSFTDSAWKIPDRVPAELAVASEAARIRMLGSVAVDMTWLAEGLIDACVILGNTLWDICAGVVIAAEAGAVVSDRDGTPYTTSSAIVLAGTATTVERLRHLV